MMWSQLYFSVGVTLEKKFEMSYHELERHHWWYAARRELILKLIKKYFANKDIEILEVGCSTGILVEELLAAGYSRIQGLDISAEAVEKAKAKNLPVSNGSALNIETHFPNRKFDLIIASDVLEHIQTDHIAVNHWSSVLKDNGYMMIFVPAYQSLWSHHDILNLHHKRYTLPELLATLPKELKIIEKSYWNFLLFLPILIARKLLPQKKSESGDLKKHNPLINKALSKILSFENFVLLNRGHFPFGVSAFSVVKKVGGE